MYVVVFFVLLKQRSWEWISRRYLWKLPRSHL